MLLSNKGARSHRLLMLLFLVLSHPLGGSRAVRPLSNLVCRRLILTSITLTSFNLGNLEELHAIYHSDLKVVVDLEGLSLMAELGVVIPMVKDVCNG